MGYVICEVEQGTDEWLALRAGRLTGSKASTLVTPTGRSTTTYRNEIARIIAERLKLQPAEYVPETHWIDRGKEMESEARDWFAVDIGATIRQVGFVHREFDDVFGFSPDGLVDLTHEHFSLIPPGETWADIPVEIKCPKPSTHIKWLLDGIVPGEHIAQVKFGGHLMGKPATVFMSYCPGVDPLILLNTHRDDGVYIPILQAGMESYLKELRAAYERVTGGQL